MSKKLILLGFTIVLLSSTAVAQKARDWITLGDQSAEQNDWMAALTCYSNAFELDSAEFDYAVKYAEALRMTRDYEKSEYYYNKLYNKDRGKVYKQGQFWLAMMQKQNGHYSEALRNFKKYSKKVKRDSEGYEYKKCIQEIQACTWAINERRDDSEVQIEKIDDPISTPASDLGAWLLPDSSFLFASARKKGNEIPIHLWHADYDSLYSKPELVNGGVLQQQANVCFADDGETVFYCECDAANVCSIYKGTWNNGKIKGGEPLGHVNKAGYTSTMPHWAVIDGKEVLFYASNRPGGSGKLDQLLSDGKNESMEGTQKEKGTGLGLEICKDLLTRNKAKLTIESELGKGTLMKVCIPM